MEQEQINTTGGISIKTELELTLPQCATLEGILARELKKYHRPYMNPVLHLLQMGKTAGGLTLSISTPAMDITAMPLTPVTTTTYVNAVAQFTGAGAPAADTDQS